MGKLEHYLALADQLERLIAAGDGPGAMEALIEGLAAATRFPHVHVAWSVGTWYEVQTVGASPDIRTRSAIPAEALAGWIATWRKSALVTIRGEYIGERQGPVGSRAMVPPGERRRRDDRRPGR